MRFDSSMFPMRMSRFVEVALGGEIQSSHRCTVEMRDTANRERVNYPSCLNDKLVYVEGEQGGTDDQIVWRGKAFRVKEVKFFLQFVDRVEVSDPEYTSIQVVADSGDYVLLSNHVVVRRSTN
jgi:hypothetical protein